jgi:hypothetical protein
MKAPLVPQLAVRMPGPASHLPFVNLLRASLRPARLMIGLLAGILAASADAQEAERLAVGSRLERLTVGNQTFHQVEITAVNARTVVFRHAKGLASVLLRHLDEESQVRFGYDEAVAQEAEEHEVRALAEAQVRQQALLRAQARSRAHDLPSGFDELLRKMVNPPEVLPQVDLRPKLHEWSLGVKNQGRRPSCAVFAVVSALEYQNAVVFGEPEKLSEEYLIWAARQVTRRQPRPEAAAKLETDDEGFRLAEVVAALRAYGIPLQSAMPNTFGSRMSQISSPPSDIVEEARARQRVFIHPLLARDTDTLMAKLIHALNAEVPVPVGLRWPHPRTLRSGVIHQQSPIPGYAHAVTLVGYTSRSGRLDDVVFLFKNSYGPSWGQGGYGWVTAAYLRANLLDAVMLEVQRGNR